MWEALGRWFTLPGRITVSIIGHNCSIFQSDTVRELYVKALTVTIWFVMVLIILVFHPPTMLNVLSSAVDVFIKNSVSNTSGSSTVGVIVIMTVFFGLAVPMVSIMYAIVLGSMVKLISWLIYEIWERRPELSWRSTLNKLGSSYKHIRTCSLLFILNFAFLVFFTNGSSTVGAKTLISVPTWVKPLATTITLILLASLLAVFGPLLIFMCNNLLTYIRNIRTSTNSRTGH